MRKLKKNRIHQYLTPILGWSGNIKELRKILKKMNLNKDGIVIIIGNMNEKGTGRTYHPKSFGISSKGDFCLYLND